MIKVKQGRPAVRHEFAIASIALITLLAAQWMLCAAVHGTNYTGNDGKMAQVTILAALEFAGRFTVTNIGPIEGMCLQLLPVNVWANPAYWPFAFLDSHLAMDVSAPIALAVFAASCYVMMRCFDVPILPSAIAAQLCVVLFGPAVLILKLATVFCLTPGNAVVSRMPVGRYCRHEMFPGEHRSAHATLVG
jgi:hypothetical protein